MNRCMFTEIYVVYLIHILDRVCAFVRNGGVVEFVLLVDTVAHHILDVQSTELWYGV